MGVLQFSEPSHFPIQSSYPSQHVLFIENVDLNEERKKKTERWVLSRS